MKARTTPEMEKEEIEFILSYIKPTPKSFFEWGSGGSTIFFEKFCSRYVSIEHFQDWANLIQPLVGEKVEYYIIPNNKPRSDNDTPKEDFLDYVNAVDSFKGQIFDFVLVDGRARKFCAERALDIINDNSIVFIHDWSRPRYREYVLDFYDIVEELHGIVALKKKKILSE